MRKKEGFTKHLQCPREQDRHIQKIMDYRRPWKAYVKKKKRKGLKASSVGQRMCTGDKYDTLEKERKSFYHSK